VLVRAHVPQLGLRRYSVELRSLTHGSASFTRAFAHYERAPDGIG
jgi:elongation factor G